MNKRPSIPVKPALPVLIPVNPSYARTRVRFTGIGAGSTGFTGNARPLAPPNAHAPSHLVGGRRRGRRQPNLEHAQLRPYSRRMDPRCNCGCNPGPAALSCAHRISDLPASRDRFTKPVQARTTPVVPA